MKWNIQEDAMAKQVTQDMLLAPGPVQVPEQARLAMARSLIHHRTPAFRDVFVRVRDGLSWVFGTSQPVMILTCSGTGAFEAAMINYTRTGDKIISIGGGKFGQRWSEVGEAYGLDVIDYELEWGAAADPERLAELLEAHPDCAMVTLSHSETSSGVLHPLEEIAQVVKRAPNALLAVDGITSVGVHPVLMDEWGIDVLVSGSQKGFAIPPGLAFVAVSERARARAASSDHTKYYFDLRREWKKQSESGQTAFTPAVSLVMALDEVIALMKGEGLESVHARHALHADAMRAAVVALGMELLSERPSNCTTAALVPDGVSAPAVTGAMRDELGVTVAGGQEHLKSRLVRMGHLGFVSRGDVLAGISALELALAQAGAAVEFGAGLAAAQRVYADDIGA